MSDLVLILQLFFTFFIIGIFTFGGGFAMISLIQAEIVVKHQWLNNSQFTDIIAISQMTPGPIGVNSATYVGYEVLKTNGANEFICIISAILTSLAVILPSFIIILILVFFYNKAKSNKHFNTIMDYLKPCVIGLIGSAAVIMIFDIHWDGKILFSHLNINILKENFVDWKSFALLAVSLIASLKFKINPLLILVFAAIAGLIIY